MQSRCLDPKNDFAFKKVFGSEKNKDILIHFLNDLLDRQYIGLMQNVEFVPTINHPETAAKKQRILDVMCQDDKGMFYIVEMQVASTEGFEKRAQYYAAKAYSNQMHAGDAYENLKAVVFIAITDFVLCSNKAAVKSDHILLDKQTKSHDLRDLYFTFIELPKFTKPIDELESLTEKWYYCLKNAPATITATYQVLILDAPVIQRAYEELDRFNWTDTALNTYDSILKRDLDNAAALRYQLKQAKEQGIQQGLEKTAKQMLQDGEPMEKLQKWTGLSEEIIRSL